MHLLIAGIPASGKTSFGQWLDAKGLFVHIDVDEDDVIEEYRLRGVWSDFVRTTDATALVGALNGIGRPVALSWGFPPHCLPLIEALNRAGIRLVWFAADWADARERFLERDGVEAIDSFERRRTALSHAWPYIEPLFAGSIVMAFDQAGRHRSAEQIWNALFPAQALS